MKNSLFKKSVFDNDTLLSALKKAQTQVGTGITATLDAKGAVTPSKEAAVLNVPTNPLKLEQNEARLNEAEKVVSPKGEPKFDGETFSRTPRMSEIQQNEEYYHYETRRKQNQTLEAFESILRNKLYGEPLAEKPVPQDNGVDALDETGSAPLRPGGPLAKNGARTRGYTDTASDVGAPIQFTAGTEEDKRRKFDDAMSRQAVTMNEFTEYLENSYIDLSNLTAEQEDILDLVKKELSKKSVLGTLTNAEKNQVFDNTLRFLYSNTRSANGDYYPVYIDIMTNDYTRKMMPELGSIQTDGLSETEMDAIFDYGRQRSQNTEQNKIYEQQREYKNAVFMEEIEKYNIDLRRGVVKEGDFQEYYDRAMMTIYETCIMPIPVKDKKGKSDGSVAIGDLIAPYDDRFGAEVARTAFQLIGLPYGEKAGQGNRPNLKIDCQGLVRWVLSEIDTDWGDYGIGKGARYQIDDTDATWSIDLGRKIVSDDLQVGNTLFWQGDETGKITHTAIYIGNLNEVDYMIEAAGDTVRIVPLRKHTSNPDGEDSTLCQINQMSPERLDENVTNYFQTDNS